MSFSRRSFDPCARMHAPELVPSDHGHVSPVIHEHTAATLTYLDKKHIASRVRRRPPPGQIDAHTGVSSWWHVLGSCCVALPSPGTEIRPSLVLFFASFFTRLVGGQSILRAWTILAFLHNFTGNSVGRCIWRALHASKRPCCGQQARRSFQGNSLRGSTR